MSDFPSALSYEIYAFPYETEGVEGEWKKFACDQDKKNALKQAEKLFRSYEFLKVQVDERYIDPGSNITVTKTLKIFENKQISNLNPVMLIALIGLSAFLLSLFVMIFCC